MKEILCLISISIITISMKSTYASPPPVTHSHEGRTHRHILPNNGIGNHNHNRGHINKRSTKIRKMTNWIQDRRTGCRVYNPHPVANETITWSGKCKNGYANGVGYNKWYKNGILQESYLGSMTKGKFNNNVTVTKTDKNGKETEMQYSATGKYIGLVVTKKKERVSKIKLDISRAINFYENTGDALLFLGMIKHISNEGGYLPNPYGPVAKILKFVTKTSRLHYPGRRRSDIYGTVYKDELVVAYPFNGRTHVFPLDYPKVLANALINNTRINTDNLSASTTVGGKASEIDYSDYGNYEKITRPSIEQRRLGISIDNNNGNHSDIESTLNRGFSGSIYDAYNTIQDGLDALEPLFRKKKR